MTMSELKTHLINYGWNVKLDTFTKNGKVIYLSYASSTFKFAMANRGGDLLFSWSTHDFKLDTNNHLLVIDDELAIRL